MESSRPLPAVRVRTWQVLLRMETGDHHLTPTPSGIHAMVSSWLHRSPGGDGEPHSEEHRYAVRWRQVSEFAVLVELRLLDEITSALDPVLVGEVLDLVLDLKRTGSTILMATHEIGFARSAADRVVFLERGQIIEQGPPERVIDDPQESATKDFLARVLR